MHRIIVVVIFHMFLTGTNHSFSYHYISLLVKWLIKRLNEWKDSVENRGVQVNMNKSEVMISGEWPKLMQKAAQWPCGVCGRGIGNNSMQCTSCLKWVHKKCSGINGTMSKVMKLFICRGCVSPVTKLHKCRYWC